MLATWKINNGVLFLKQNQRTIGQKKGDKTLYKNDKALYSTFDFALFILALGVGEPYFGNDPIVLLIRPK